VRISFPFVKIVKFKINLGLPVMVHDLVYKFEIICWRGTWVEIKWGMGICMEWRWVKPYVLPMSSSREIKRQKYKFFMRQLLSL
jgi:hypothetical protein